MFQQPARVLLLVSVMFLAFFSSSCVEKKAYYNQLEFVNLGTRNGLTVPLSDSDISPGFYDSLLTVWDIEKDSIGFINFNNLNCSATTPASYNSGDYLIKKTGRRYCFVSENAFLLIRDAILTQDNHQERLSLCRTDKVSQDYFDFSGLPVQTKRNSAIQLGEEKSPYTFYNFGHFDNASKSAFVILARNIPFDSLHASSVSSPFLIAQVYLDKPAQVIANLEYHKPRGNADFRHNIVRFYTCVIGDSLAVFQSNSLSYTKISLREPSGQQKKHYVLSANLTPVELLKNDIALFNFYNSMFWPPMFNHNGTGYYRLLNYSTKVGGKLIMKRVLLKMHDETVLGERHIEPNLFPLFIKRDSVFMKNSENPKRIDIFKQIGVKRKPVVKDSY